MKILFLHNRYLEPGGEDLSARAEANLLKGRDHEVVLFEESNERIARLGRVRVAARAVWSQESYRRVDEIIKRDKPDIISAQNIFPLISPSVYYAAFRNRVPIIQTLRNYRLLCLNALLLRNGRICEDCVEAPFPLKGVLHSCYRGSRAGSIAVCAMIGAHRAARTWKDRVTFYVALTEFAKQKFVKGGLPAEKIVVKPNFLPDDPGVGSPKKQVGLFVGRLSPEKGVDVLIDAWKKSGTQNKLLIVGDGPMRSAFESECRGYESISLLGRLPTSEVLELMKTSSFLVFPSIWYEGMPRTIIEAFACGLPVIASDLGGMGEMVADRVTGRLFTPRNVDDLAEKVSWAWSNGFELKKMGEAARRTYEGNYSAKKNYEMMMAIYKKAIDAPRR